MALPETPTLDEYETSDLGVASFLVARDIPLLRTDNRSERTSFVFPGTAEEIARGFYQPGKDLVSARRLHAALRELRSLTRQGRWR